MLSPYQSQAEKPAFHNSIKKGIRSLTKLPSNAIKPQIRLDSSGWINPVGFDPWRISSGWIYTGRTNPVGFDSFYGPSTLSHRVVFPMQN